MKHLKCRRCHSDQVPSLNAAGLCRRCERETTGRPGKPAPSDKKRVNLFTQLDSEAARARWEHPEDLIDMTAMVDIVFFLLIFFLVTTMASIETAMPLSEPAPTDLPSTNVRSTVSLDETVNVYIDEDNRIWIEGDEVVSDQSLRRELRRIKAQAPQIDTLLVRGDRNASHGALVSVLDAATMAGITQRQFSIGNNDDESF